MDAVMNYTVSCVTDPFRVVLALLTLVFLIIGFFRGTKKECTARAVGTIVRAKDKEWSFWKNGFLGTDEFPVREVVIRYRIGERDMTVTDNVRQGRRVHYTARQRQAYKGTRLGDSVVVCYNPNKPSEYFLEYGDLPKDISPLIRLLIAFFFAAFALFMPIWGYRRLI